MSFEIKFIRQDQKTCRNGEALHFLVKLGLLHICYRCTNYQIGIFLLKLYLRQPLFEYEINFKPISISLHKCKLDFSNCLS